MSALRASARRSTSQSPKTSAAPASSRAVPLARMNSEMRMKRLSAESDLPPKSCSTEENCGSTNRMKNSITQIAAISTNSGYCIASVSLRRIASARIRSWPNSSST